MLPESRGAEAFVSGMNAQRTAMAIRAIAVTVRNPLVCPKRSTTNPDTEVEREAPTPEKVPTRP
jgi:hypothetical protein